MNKQEWILAIKNMKAVGNNSLPLHWTGDDWKRWAGESDEGRTDDQNALLHACFDLDLEPCPGDVSPDTITFR